MEYAVEDVPETDLDDINGHIHSAVGGFFEKYFRGKSWSPTVEEIARDADGLLGCDVLECLSTSLFLSWGGRHVFQYTFSTQLDETAPRLRLLLTRPESGPHQRYDWATVQVVGSVQTNTRDGYVRGLLHLCDYARLVFTFQPTRLFLHGFYVFGSTMELWMFDRSGMYSSEPFDVCNHLDRLTTIIAGYSRMSDEELGINPIVQQDDGGRYVLAKGGDKSEVHKLYLEGPPLALPDNIFSQAPTCYRARRSDSTEREFVVKFSWASRRPRTQRGHATSRTTDWTETCRMCGRGGNEYPMTCSRILFVEKTDKGTYERRGLGEISTRALEIAGQKGKWIFLE